MHLGAVTAPKVCLIGAGILLGLSFALARTPSHLTGSGGTAYERRRFRQKLAKALFIAGLVALSIAIVSARRSP